MARGQRLLIVGMCAVLMTTQPIGAGARGSRGTRVETKDYIGPSPTVALDTSGFYASACTAGGIQDPWERSCLQFDLKPKDRYISLEIEDESGQRIYGVVWDDSDESLRSFCGKTKRPIPNPGGDSIYVEVVAANTSEGCYPSTVTEGTVTATFTRERG
ncbi:MAG: hypothetical protein ACRDJL_01600 [Actinomycetota bacterium]